MAHTVAPLTRRPRARGGYTVGLVLVMGILATRQGMPFIPMRDYQLFVQNVSGD